jgi:dihydrofolate reductase
MITLVVAVSDNDVIGRANQLPWHLPEDLKHFKRVTLGKPIVMGRKTYESIGKPLPGRHNIVVTRSPNYRAEGVTVVAGVDEAIAAAGEAAEVMVIGGAELFKLFLPRAGRLHLTRVHGNIEGDVYWPALDASAWRLVQRADYRADERHAWDMSFEVWERRTS